MSGKHPEVNFVYITYDAERERRREFDEAGLKDFKPTSNYYIIHMERAEIDSLQLTLGYPTKYYLNNRASVRRVKTGGKDAAAAAEWIMDAINTGG